MMKKYVVDTRINSCVLSLGMLNCINCNWISSDFHDYIKTYHQNAILYLNIAQFKYLMD